MAEAARRRRRKSFHSKGLRRFSIANGVPKNFAPANPVPKVFPAIFIKY